MLRNAPKMLLTSGGAREVMPHEIGTWIVRGSRASTFRLRLIGRLGERELCVGLNYCSSNAQCCAADLYTG